MGLSNWRIKGLDQLQRHIPGYHSPAGLLRLFLPPVVLVLLITALFNALGPGRPLLQLLIEIALTGLAFVWFSLFFRVRDSYKRRFGPLAYNRAVERFGYPAVAILAALVTRIRSLPGPPLPLSGVLPILGWVLVAAGLLAFLRVLQAFGFDNLTMLYVYFPEESRLVDRKIYDILRHPAYASAQYIAFGLALLNGNWFALAAALCFSLGLWAWVSQVEEMELVERFGASYNAYRRRVPAFWPRPRDLPAFFALLIAGRRK